MITEKTPVCKVDCCPVLHPWQSCDELDVRYRLPFRPVVQTRDGEQQLLVEVTVCFRLECCSGPLFLGDLLYSTTLLPGEKVRLLTTDRNSRFSFSSDAEYAARQFTTSEQSFFLAGMADSMSNLDVLRQGANDSFYQSSAASGGHYAGLDLGFLDIGGYASASSYDASSASAFFNSLSEHAESSSRKVETSVRAATSTSVSEVASRTHAEGQSEDKYESASREFANPNRCHALTYLFYRIEKVQKLRFTLVAIERRVDDPACPTGIHPLTPVAGTTGTANGGNGPAADSGRCPRRRARPGRRRPAGRGTAGRGRQLLRRDDRAAVVGADRAPAHPRRDGQGLPGRVRLVRARPQAGDRARAGCQGTGQQAAAAQDRASGAVPGVPLLPGWQVLRSRRWRWRWHR
jgi:hypothetical protein